MPNIAWFKELNKEKVNLVGGKGASLGEMSNIGLPIPPGFVVTTKAYRKFIGQIAPKIYPDLKKLDVENNDQLQALAKSIQELIIKTEMPQDLQEEITEAYEALDTKDMLTQSEPFVAVRSSANAEDGPEASFAGQNATYLNMKGKQKVLAA
ncbi:phosphoenolpyruvate synthase, partial [archaeon]|nr:phosphoenolpyruvate synthase [archaeon]